MSNMQVFHTRLFQTSEIYDPCLGALAQLTEIALPQLKVLRSDLGWSDWGVEVA